jgi:hypothetical protein
MLRRRSVPFSGLGEGSDMGVGPLDLGAVGDVLAAAGHGLSQEGPEDPGEDTDEEDPARQPIRSDADPATQGVFSGPDGGMHHVRVTPMAGPSSGGSTGSYGVTHTPVGAPGDGAV